VGSAGDTVYSYSMTRYRNVNRLEPAIAAYLAGLIDGEGTVTMTRQHRNEMRRLVVCISNNELAILEFARNVIGAGRITRKRTYNVRHANSYAYQVSSRQALDVLAQILPYMKSHKTDRAALALQDYVRLTPRNGKYAPATTAERKTFEERLLAIRAGPSN
jgi:hypothetical protein